MNYSVRRVPIFLVILLILPPVFLVFLSIFRPGPLAWGDAPYFFPEGARQLLFEPSAWTQRGINLGGINSLLWISPWMFLWGIGSVLGMGSDLTVRLLFYLPALALAAFSPLLITRYLKLSSVVQFFACLLYVLNTYFILLIDGGVVGVALAYGLFPVVLFFLKKFFDRPSYIGYWWSLLFCFLLTIIDPRILIICFLTAITWVFLEKLASKDYKALVNLAYAFLLIVGLVGLSAYWIVPLIKLGSASSSPTLSSDFTLLNTLTLYQPHWPANIFGKLTPTPFYFVGIPFLIFLPLLGKTKKITYLLALLFLIFAFLTKGTSAPFGGIYEFVIRKIPFGFAFRDASKFFAPLVLFAGILIGITVDKFKNRYLALLVYIFLLFLVMPALLGKMNFVLSKRNQISEFKKIYQNLAIEKDSFRVAWFPEKHPLAFETSEKPAISAKELVNLRPLARLNGGTYDKFNYMHNPEYLDWYDIFGIKYLVLSGDPRIVQADAEQSKNWKDLSGKLATASGLTKVDWGTETDIYQNDNFAPKIYALDKLAVVVGAEVPGVFQAAYFEDGKFDPLALEGVVKDAAVLVFNKKEKIDLQMSFLQKYFIPAIDAENSDWANYSTEDYLLYKYQLAIRGLAFTDFDYSKGISFSTKANEKISFNQKIPFGGKYTLAVRAMQSTDGQGLRVFVDGSQVNESGLKVGNLGWLTNEIALGKGDHKISIENRGGLAIVNTIALVPQIDWDKAAGLTETYLKHFQTTEIGQAKRLMGKVNIKQIGYKPSGTNKFIVSGLTDESWVVLNDSYDKRWKVRRDNLTYQSIPIYSAVNAFYKRPEWDTIEIEYDGQEEVRWGIYFSLVSALLLIIVFLWFLPQGKDNN